MREIIYNREKAVDYAHKWAFSRNPRYYSFDAIGGDCTNFISQILYTGCPVMNYGNPGWFYSSLNKRSPSWTGVEFLHDFLVGNRSVGPYAVDAEVKDILPGDIIQLKFEHDFYEHSLIVVEAGSPAGIDNILVATHTLDSDNRPLYTYAYSDFRCIHILGGRKW